MSNEDLKLRLENWGKWARDRRFAVPVQQKVLKDGEITIREVIERRLMPTPQCGSGEGKYLPPQGNVWETASELHEAQEARRIDLFDAVAIQKVIGRYAVANPRSGYQYAWALTFEYCYPNYSKVRAARICLVYNQFKLEGLTRKAEYMVRNNLKSITAVLNESDIKDTNEYRTGVILYSAQIAA